MSRKRDTRSALTELFQPVQGQREAPGLMLLNRSRITLAPQVRADFAGVDELRANIAQMKERKLGIEETGILQPLLVAPDPDKEGRFRLIAGERRFRASEGVTDELPVIVSAPRSDSLLLMQLIENLQRRDLNPLEEARGLQTLIEEQKLSVRDAAQLLGKTKSYLSDRLALLKMGEDVQQMVSERSDTLIHAREVDRVQDPQLRANLVGAVRKEGISLAEVRRRSAPSGRIEKPNVDGQRQEAHEPPKVSERSDSSASKTESSNVAPTTPILKAASTVDRAAKVLQELVNSELSASERQQVLQDVAAAQARLKDIKARLA